MILSYLGEGCFRLQSGDTSVLVNPTSNRLKGDAVLRTLVATENPVVPGEFTFAGEYEIKGIEIQGFEVGEESTDKYVKTIFAVDWEGTRFVFAGHLSHLPSEELTELIGEADVLVVPTGEKHFLSVAEAAKLIKRLEPKVVVPAHYGPGKGNDLVKELGLTPEKEEKWVFKRKDLGEGKTRLLVLASTN